MVPSKIIIGNWKMNKSPQQSRQFFNDFLPLLSSPCPSVWLAVPFVDIQVCAELASSHLISIGAQNVSDRDHGPFTGEISCDMIRECGALFSLIGHSERRHLFSEDDQVVQKKVASCVKSGLKAVLCVGETLAQKEGGRACSSVQEQVKIALDGLLAEDMKQVLLAYEPVWAIGTGQSASLDHITFMHSCVRFLLQDLYGPEVAQSTPILYGGSVDEHAIQPLLARVDVDGVLVGGASLHPEKFAKLCSIGINK